MSGHRSIGWLAAFLVAAAFTGIVSRAAAADEEDSNDLSARVGAERTVGKYGTTQATTIWTFPFDLLYSTDNYEFDLDVPYVRMTGPAGAIAGHARRRPRVLRPVTTESGIGDSTLSATRDLVDGGDTGVSWDAGATVKFATGDVHRGLGSGATDYSLSTDLAKKFEKLSLNGTLGHWWLGSPGVVTINGVQEDVQFRNVFYGELGASYRTSDTAKYGISYFQEHATERGGYPQREITLDANFDTSQATALQVYLLRGLARGSPARGIGLSFTASM